MNIKQKVISDFLNHEKFNYDIFQTNQTELGEMFDKLMDWFKGKNRTLTGFLVTENAMHPDGTVRCDRRVSYTVDKAEKEVSIVFKYFIYNYLYREAKRIKDDTKEIS